MSLSRIALRIAAVEAIKGKTLVLDNVLDTPNGAMDVQADGRLRTEEDKPFVSVFTDRGKAESATGRSLIENGTCDIVFEIGISTAMFETNRQTGVTMLLGVNIPASDRSSEFFLDVVQRQICDALTDPHNAWAEIYRSLHDGIRSIEFMGARSTDDGQKLAGHQLRLSVDLIDDPVKGDPIDPQHPLALALAAMEASGDPVYQGQASTMRSLIAGSNEAWDSLHRSHGLTLGELRALGLAPAAADPNEEFGVAGIAVNGQPVEVADDQ